MQPRDFAERCNTTRQSCGYIRRVARHNGYWKKHPRKELQQLLLWCDELGWRIEDPPTYYRLFCPCGDHMETVHLTPSDPRYERNKRKQIERTMRVCRQRLGDRGD